MTSGDLVTTLNLQTAKRELQVGDGYDDVFRTPRPKADRSYRQRRPCALIWDHPKHEVILATIHLTGRFVFMRTTAHPEPGSLRFFLATLPWCLLLVGLP